MLELELGFVLEWNFLWPNEWINLPIRSAQLTTAHEGRELNDTSGKYLEISASGVRILGKWHFPKQVGRFTTCRIRNAAPKKHLFYEQKMARANRMQSVENKRKSNALTPNDSNYGY